MDLYNAPRPVIFGEALFDVFPDKEVLGGAPFNVAWNLRGFGLNPIFISRVGDDAKGETVFDSMKEFGLDTIGVQIDQEYPTGIVKIEMDGENHCFDILADQAYDFIDAREALASLNKGPYGLLYHGTLAKRYPMSRKALYSIRDTLTIPLFVDVNIRLPWSDGNDAAEAVRGATWAKLNDEELNEITGTCQVDGDGLKSMGEYFMKETRLDLLVLTRGEKGAYFISKDGTLEGTPPPAENIEDTVGAGDAFAAVTIMGLMFDWPKETTLKRALDFSSAICGIRGATSKDLGLYRAYAELWGLADI